MTRRKTGRKSDKDNMIDTSATPEGVGEDSHIRICARATIGAEVAVVGFQNIRKDTNESYEILTNSKTFIELPNNRKNWVSRTDLNKIVNIILKKEQNGNGDRQGSSNMESAQRKKHVGTDGSILTVGSFWAFLGFCPGRPCTPT